MASMKKKFIILDETKNIEGTKLLRNPTFTLHSQRFIANFIPDEECIRMLRFEPKERVFYVTNEKIDDIYEFVFRCRVTKDIIPRYCFGDFKNRDEMEKASVEIYHLASGDKLPQNVDMNMKLLIQRYLFYGLIHLNFFHERNLGKRNKQNAKDNHYFLKEDAWALDLGGLFIGMIVDYFDIDPGVDMMDAQRAFMLNPKYREEIFEKIKELFIKFNRENTEPEKHKEETDLHKIIERSKEILVEYIKS